MAYGAYCKMRALIWLDLPSRTFHVFVVFSDHGIYEEHLDWLTCGMFEMLRQQGILPTK